MSTEYRDFDMDICPECSEETFKVQGHSPSGKHFYGQCLNTKCKHELSEDDADNADLDFSMNKSD